MKRRKNNNKKNKVKSVKVALVLSAQPSQSVTGAGGVFMPTYGLVKEDAQPTRLFRTVNNFSIDDSRSTSE